MTDMYAKRYIIANWKNPVLYNELSAELHMTNRYEILYSKEENHLKDNSI